MLIFNGTGQFLLSLTAGIFIGGVAGYLGTLMLSKKMALAAGPLGHLTLPGIALALLYGFDVSLGAFPFVILGIILIWLFEIKTKLPMEALTAVVFASGVAVAFLFLPIDQAETALVGDISKISFLDALITCILCLFLFLLVKKIYFKITLANISEDLARSEGINVKKYNFFYLLSIAVIVSLGVKVVGGLLTAALVAIPAAASRMISPNMKSYAFWSALFGILGCVSGIFLSKLTGLPVGPLIILVCAFFFAICFVLKKSGKK